MSFTTLGLSTQILEAVADQGYDTPTPIQAQAIPAIIEGKDVMAAAQTGTGKTAGFTLPILELLTKGTPAKSNQVRALILTPTRELAAQVVESVATYGSKLPLKSAVVFGGVKINPQMMKLRQGVDVLVATPGRLLDLFNQNAINFSTLEILVLDEADRMLDMGFINDIRKILKLLPKQRQNLMFSATFSSEIRQLAKGLVNDPVEISVTPRNTTVALVEQWVISVEKSNKPSLLCHLINQGGWAQVLVFTRTKHGANRLTKYLEKNKISAAAIHGNKSQGARTRALAEFKSLKVQVLVATDIAARGLDIELLPQVVNFDLPNVPEDYIHRIGRTGRAGSTGQAYSLVCQDERKQLKDIERLIGSIITRKQVEGYDSSEALPETLDTRPIRSNKPKRNKPQNNKPQSNKPQNNKHKPKSKSWADKSRQDHQASKKKSPWQKSQHNPNSNYEQSLSEGQKQKYGNREFPEVSVKPKPKTKSKSNVKQGAGNGNHG